MMKRDLTEEKKKIDLPEDLIVEIFSRVSESSLTRFRSLSKIWNDTIEKDKRLLIAKMSRIIMLNIDSKVYLTNVETHQQNKIVNVTRQFGLKDPLRKYYSKEVDIREIYHCDGLLLCTTHDYRIAVWNPFSGETSWIKPRNSNNARDFYTLGKSSCNKYKILRMVHHGNGYDGPYLVEYEIYDFTSNSWREVGKSRDWTILREWSSGTYVKGSAYWLAIISDI